MKRTLTVLKSLSALFVLFVLTNCGGNVVGNGVVPDTTMLGLLCPPGKDIFTGSDGAISVPVSEGKSLWIWGDAFMGEVVDNQRGDSVSTPLIYGNLFVELDGERSPDHLRGNAPTSAAGHPERQCRWQTGRLLAPSWVRSERYSPHIYGADRF